ncbi:GDP-mannose-dependent alpha-(1-6)-phosphatidylinositol monomannoside mannosyltransferase [Fundidesulfovibrio magnetotacticus]|uniref:GDP-mannose-dependent alpha-(1-6)-phosphatidylinositol monomannoside mannosyltransferase n=1 Tax=Fundidesulfovibrio magnetotacticus TaxID=2730080 RepID=A0A6V8LMK2_9BACT|nr:glycosyltransferase family 4 protein [Fundidesulfovibrio magnetotacticus]GFK93902.1 GDP-mannose-dependent alpha-(1-6)-phosphatidylinositol monomannoside mannosyltransferase [Fundidesulfovibrio magnetotacticus]
MTMRSLLVLDQWASPDATVGTSKNWLYEGLGRRFKMRLLNADGANVQTSRRLSSLSRALLTNPLHWREAYHHELEWESKRPASFQKRTTRFQRALNRLNGPVDAVLQIGCLFGPVCRTDALHASYHDQTVAMVERGWRAWLPPEFHHMRDRWMELERNALESRDLILTYSEAAKRSMIHDYGIDECKVHVAPTACKIVYPEEAAARSPRPGRIVFASTDFLRKGGDIVLKGFQIMRRSKPELELVLVGGAVNVSLPEGARNLGMVPHESLVKLFLNSSLILHPARHDAFPNVLKEAIACGLPAVASDSAGIPEIIHHGRTGIVLNQPTPESLADASLELLTDTDRLDGMREACIKDRELFHPDSCVERICSILDRSLDVRSKDISI